MSGFRAIILKISPRSKFQRSADLVGIPAWFMSYNGVEGSMHCSMWMDCRNQCFEHQVNRPKLNWTFSCQAISIPITNLSGWRARLHEAIGNEIRDGVNQFPSLQYYNFFNIFKTLVIFAYAWQIGPFWQDTLDLIGFAAARLQWHLSKTKGIQTTLQLILQNQNFH